MLNLVVLPLLFGLRLLNNMMRLILVFFLLCPITLTWAQQEISIVKSIEISDVPTKSYHVTSYGKLLPGASAKGIDGIFILKADWGGY
jgi:hypothetical protein